MNGYLGSNKYFLRYLSIEMPVTVRFKYLKSFIGIFNGIFDFTGNLSSPKKIKGAGNSNYGAQIGIGIEIDPKTKLIAKISSFDTVPDIDFDTDAIKIRMAAKAPIRLTFGTFCDLNSTIFALTQFQWRSP